MMYFKQETQHAYMTFCTVNIYAISPGTWSGPSVSCGARLWIKMQLMQYLSFTLLMYNMNMEYFWRASKTYIDNHLNYTFSYKFSSPFSLVRVKIFVGWFHWGENARTGIHTTRSNSFFTMINQTLNWHERKILLLRIFTTFSLKAS